MSLTEAQEVFASVHEDALNDLITAFCTDRPRYLVYGSPSFVPVTTVSATAIPAIPFPGVPGGINWRIVLGIPQIDLFDQDNALPPELSMGPGQFSGQIEVELCIDCRRLQIDPKDPRPFDPRRGHKPSDDRPRDPDRDERDHPLSELTCFKLRVFLLGHLQRVIAMGGEDAVALVVDQVEIVDIEPDGLESFLECLLFMVLQAALAEIRLPLRALRAGAFQLIPVVGPLIEDDQIKMRGNV
ncbi:hypothetical protein K3172_14905 [Qipengyuania sp. 6B39]|uniref:hypothetical protein n=1 Tax=Qipengyuania proteolytica TaxID=2867239 RepID=UPI001C8A937C|nr:hypothetical protein [Qipengyuania proteolytica]MBX7497146.1 hypothetical protein [Qipengyuania proteolytica]